MVSGSVLSFGAAALNLVSKILRGGLSCPYGTMIGAGMSYKTSKGVPFPKGVCCNEQGSLICFGTIATTLERSNRSPPISSRERKYLQ